MKNTLDGLSTLALQVGLLLAIANQFYVRFSEGSTQLDIIEASITAVWFIAFNALAAARAMGERK